MTRLTLLDEVTWEGRPVPGERTHALLRALADAGRRGLSDERLVDDIWGDDTPANPGKALQVVVSRARAATDPEAIERTPRGYRLALAEADVDAWALRPTALRLMAEGCDAEALPLLERLTPDDEVTAALIRATATVHGTPAALERYETYREGLADSLGVDPSPALQGLHRELLARDRPVHTGLRFDADELIGRQPDVAALLALVRSHRLVSIVGAGGLGKTRLAHLLGRLAEQPVVHFVELVSVTAAAGVAVEVADVLGARESVASRKLAGRDDVVGRIVDQVGTVPSLLILDNCEQVVDGVADLVSALLARTPSLTVLATTRIPLGLSAERVYQLPELTTEDAAALFEARAVSARPGVVLDPDRVRTLVERLDGLPLAVELAAAKVRVMSVEEIERRLDNRFALLRGGSRDAPERHQTLVAVIDWSWNLLTEEQRVGLRRLSVFRDGFSLEGASALMGYDALDLVTQLVEQSLVAVREDDGVRYRLLETVREFGRMQLVDAGDDGEASKLLRRWAVDLAGTALETLFTPEQVEAMSSVRSEEGNLVEVLRQASDASDVATVAPVLAALTGFWSVEGAHLKVVNLGIPAAALLASEPVPPGLEDAERASLSLTVMLAAVFTGGPSPEVMSRLRELGPGSDDPRLRASVEVILALADDAPFFRPEALGGLVDSDDVHVAQLACMWASQGYENLGDLAAAVACAERSLALVDTASGPWSRALVIAHLAGLELQRGNRVLARDYAREALPVMLAVGALEDWAQCRSIEALVAITDGELELADRILAELEGDERLRSVFGGRISQICGRAELLLAQGREDEGLAAYRSAVEELTYRSIPGVEFPSNFTPWVLFPQGASLTAHVRRGRRPAATYDDLRAKLATMLSGDVEGEPARFVDYPIAGSAMFALAAWHLAAGEKELGSLLLAIAEGFTYNRMMPSFDEDWARSMATPELPAVPSDREELRRFAAQTLRE